MPVLLAKFHDWHPVALLHAARHAAEESMGAGDPSGVPLRIMSGSIAVGRFMRNVTSFPAVPAGAETASVKDAMGRAEASMSLTLYLRWGYRCEDGIA